MSQLVLPAVDSIPIGTIIVGPKTLTHEGFDKGHLMSKTSSIQPASSGQGLAMAQLVMCSEAKNDMPCKGASTKCFHKHSGTCSALDVWTGLVDHLELPIAPAQGVVRI